MAWNRSTKQRRAMERRRNREAMPFLMRQWVTEEVYTCPPVPEHPTMRDVFESVYSAVHTTRCYELHSNHLWQGYGRSACAAQ